MFKKIANPFIAVLLALALLGASVGIAFAKDLPKNAMDVNAGDKVNLSLSGAGVMSHGPSKFEGTLELARATSLDKEDVTTQNIRWAAPLLNVELQSDDKGDKQDARLNGNAFIYFDISKSMDKAAMNGMLAIYKFDENRDIWVRLPSHVISSTISEVAARANGVGTYGLAWVR